MNLIIAILTFPGVIVHEFSHELFCHVMRIKVNKVCYFRFGNPAGYVIHEKSNYFLQAFFISAGPFILGTFIAAVLFKTAGREVDILNKAVWMWLGAAVSFHCLPSSGDARTLWSENWSHFKRNLFAILGLPFTGFVWALSLLNCNVFNVFYAATIYYFANLINR